jgi:NAD(P)-dependent dehydrogenase (short-subunit alcohol dehydrogenase family)
MRPANCTLCAADEDNRNIGDRSVFPHAKCQFQACHERRRRRARHIYKTNVFGPIRVTRAFLAPLKSGGSANIVMVSSGLGSLGWLSDPDNQFYGVNFLGYNSSKSALNAIAVAFAKELTGSGIKVNAADPGYTATDQRTFRLPDGRAGRERDRVAGDTG